MAITQRLQLKVKEFMRKAKLLQYYQVLRSSGNESKLITVEDGKVVALNLSGHNIAKLPAMIDDFRYLVELNLDGCNLEELPDEIKYLTNLQYLNISNNQLKKFPGQISEFRDLLELHAGSSGSFKTLDGSMFSNLKHLTELDLSDNTIQSFLGRIELTESLEVLNLSDNQLEELDLVGKYSLLKRLDLSSNRFTQVPECVEMMENLQVLDLDQNQITEIPEALPSLHQLKNLILSDNRISSIPITLYTMSQLQILHLEFNKISEIGNEIAHMLGLKELWLGNNLLTELPDSIGRLIDLKELRLNNNQLERLPLSFLNLHLKSLNLLGNNLPIPFNFMCPDRDTVKEFFIRICTYHKQDEGPSFIEYREEREISKIHIFLETGEALATFNGLTETVDEMDAPLAGVFQLAMNIIDSEGRSFIPIKDNDGRSIQITVQDKIGLGFDFLGLHDSIDLHQDQYLKNAIENFIMRYGGTLRDRIFDLAAEDIKFSFLLYLV